MNIAEILIFSTTAVIFLSTTYSKRININIAICNDDFDCDSSQYCEDNICIDVCSTQKCLENEGCQVYNNHTSSCVHGEKNSVKITVLVTTNEVQNGFYPLYSIREQEKFLVQSEYLKFTQQILRDSTVKFVRQHDCYNDDDCGRHEICHLINNIPICQTSIQYIPDGSGKCVKSCSENSDCHFSEKCENGKCIDLCSKLECGHNEGCQTFNHTASCKCRSGYLVNEQTNICEEWCGGSTCGGYTQNIFCYDPCNKIPCGTNERCQISNGNHSCECLSGYTRNSEQKCVKNVKSQCSTDNDCHFSEICDNGTCVSVCSELQCDNVNEYTLKACLAYDHVGTCDCVDGCVYNIELKECHWFDYEMVC